MGQRGPEPARVGTRLRVSAHSPLSGDRGIQRGSGSSKGGALSPRLCSPPVSDDAPPSEPVRPYSPSLLSSPRFAQSFASFLLGLG
jgi:hypothetical protein